MVLKKCWQHRNTTVSNCSNSTLFTPLLSGTFWRTSLRDLPENWKSSASSTGLRTDRHPFSSHTPAQACSILAIGHFFVDGWKGGVLTWWVAVVWAPSWSIRRICEIEAATCLRAEGSQGAVEWGAFAPFGGHHYLSAITGYTQCRAAIGLEDVHHLQHTSSYRSWGIVSCNFLAHFCRNNLGIVIPKLVPVWIQCFISFLTNRSSDPAGSICQAWCRTALVGDFVPRTSQWICAACPTTNISQELCILIITPVLHAGTWSIGGETKTQLGGHQIWSVVVRDISISPRIASVEKSVKISTPGVFHWCFLHWLRSITLEATDVPMESDVCGRGILLYRARSFQPLT